MTNEQIINQESKMNIRQKMFKTTHDFYAYRNITSSDLAMLSELIDNSISSYKSKSENNGDVKNLKITITIHTAKNRTNSWLEIWDNASGMDGNTLDASIKPGHQNQRKQDSPINVYGLGLKQSSFFLGNCLSIMTKESKKEFYNSVKIDLKELDKNNNSEIDYEVNNNNSITSDDAPEQFKNFNCSGTIIRISDINKSRLTKSTITSDIPNLLSIKYIKYLESGMKIKIIYKDKNKEIYNEDISNKEIKLVENFSTWYTHHMKNNANRNPKYGNTKEEVMNKLISIIKKAKILNKNSEDKENYNYDFINKLKDEKDLIFDCEAVYTDSETLKKYTIKGKIGILKKYKNNDNKIRTGWSQYNGLTIYQENRAINFPVNAKHNKSPSVPIQEFKSNTGSVDNHLVRLFGHINIDGWCLLDQENDIIKLNSNKLGFEFCELKSKKNFDDMITIFKSKYSKIIKILHDFQNSSILKTGNINSDNDKDNKKLSNSIKQSTNFTNLTIKNTGEISFDIDIKNLQQKLEFKIILCQDLEPSKTIDTKLESKEDRILLTIELNINHNFWQPYMGQTTSYTNNFRILLYKTAALLGLSIRIFDIMSLRPKTDENNFDDKIDIFKEGYFKDKNYTEIINEISNNINLKSN